MPDTRVGGGSFEAIIATLDKLTEAIDLLSTLDDQRAAQLIALETAQTELRGDLRILSDNVNRVELDVIDNANAISDLRGEWGAAS